MTYHDEMTHDYADPALQAAFRAYFAELGCRVTNWEGLFTGMSEAGRDYTWTLRDEAGQVTFFMAGMDAQERDVACVRRDAELLFTWHIASGSGRQYLVFHSLAPVNRSSAGHWCSHLLVSSEFQAYGGIISANLEKYAVRGSPHGALPDQHEQGRSVPVFPVLMDTIPFRRGRA
jgi:hypothetical protein